MKNLILILSLAFLSFSCTKNDETSPSKEDLLGTWSLKSVTIVPNEGENTEITNEATFNLTLKEDENLDFDAQVDVNNSEVIVKASTDFLNESIKNWKMEEDKVYLTGNLGIKILVASTENAAEGKITFELESELVSTIISQVPEVDSAKNILFTFEKNK